MRVNYKIIICIFLSIIIFSLFNNNHDFYSTPIMKVIQIEEESGIQFMQGELKNTEQKGLIVEIVNSYEESLVYSDKYSEGNYLFLSQDLMQVVGVKRDYALVFLLLVFINILIGILGKKGLFTFLCLLSNTIIFISSLFFLDSGTNILLVCTISAIIFAVILLFFISGVSKQTLVSLLCAIATSTLITLISYIIIVITVDLDYEFLEYMPDSFGVYNSNLLFLSEILIGSLGVIIDISVTMTACGKELVDKDPKINIKEMIKSLRYLADDITGTMINVVLFTNLAGLLPIYVISVQNDIHFFTVLRYDAFFFLARFLVSSIAIVLAIPVSLYISTFVYKKAIRNKMHKNAKSEKDA